MKKSIQLDAMKRDDDKRIIKPNTGMKARVEKLIDYLYEITNIRFKSEEIRNFCNEYPESNFEDLKKKLELNYRSILLEKKFNEKKVFSKESQQRTSRKIKNNDYPKNKLIKTHKNFEDNFIVLQRITTVCNEIFGEFSRNDLELVKKINKKFPNLSQTGLRDMVQKYLDYKLKQQDGMIQKDTEIISNEKPLVSIANENNSIQLRNQSNDIISKTDLNKYLNYFIEKWILLCYSMSDGDKTLDKYIKFLRLAARKSLEYGTSVRCDWQNKSFIKISEKPLNNVEKEVLQIFQKKDLPLEILKKIEEILEFDNSQTDEVLDIESKDSGTTREATTRRMKIISVGRNWAKGKALDYNEKLCNIKLNEFFSKEEAQLMIGEEVILNCKVLIYRNKLGFIQVNIFPLGENMKLSEISLSNNDESLRKKLKTLQGEFALEENRERGSIFSHDVLIELVRRKPLTKSELLRIPEIGEQRFLKYGSAIIEVIKNHLIQIRKADE